MILRQVLFLALLGVSMNPPSSLLSREKSQNSCPLALWERARVRANFVIRSVIQQRPHSTALFDCTSATAIAPGFLCLVERLVCRHNQHLKASTLIRDGRGNAQANRYSVRYFRAGVSNL